MRSEEGYITCLKGSQTLTDFFRYVDQRCLTLYMQEALKFPTHTLQPHIRLDSTLRITSFFTMIPSERGTKWSTNISTDPNSRSMWAHGAHSMRYWQQIHVRFLLGDKRDHPSLSSEQNLLNSGATDSLSLRPILLIQVNIVYWVLVI